MVRWLRDGHPHRRLRRNREYRRLKINNLCNRDHRFNVAFPEARPEIGLRLNPLRPGHGLVAARVAGVQRGRGLEEHHGDLLVGDRPVLDAARDDKHLAFA